MGVPTGAFRIISYAIARAFDKDPLKVVIEHMLIAIGVIMATHYLEHWVTLTFGEAR